MPHALITGGAGFIGSHIVERFLEEGWNVTVWDNLITGSDHNLPTHKKLVFRTHDVTKPEEWDDLMVAPDVIVHCAAQTKVTKSDADPVFDVTTNVGGTVALMRRFPTTRFVLLSTLGAMFNDQQMPEMPVETTEPFPPSVYGLDKLLAEVALHKQHSNWVSLRLSNVYGPRQRTDLEGGVIAIWMEKLKKGLPLTCYGDGRQTRDFVSVYDVVEAVWLASKMGGACSTAPLPHPHGPNTFMHVASGASTPLLEVLEMFELVGNKPTVVHEPARDEIKHTAFPVSDRTKGLLGWEPTHDLMSFIKEEMATWTGDDR